MDRFGPRLAILTLGAAAALAGAAPPSARIPIRAAQWLDPPQRLAALTGQPLECAAIPRDPGQRQLFEIGRAAFRAPLLLGGQAARSGLSCASCHSNGRRNPAFHFPGLSGDPGTADVTSSLMSSHRGNGVFDPRQIPDLALPGRISRQSGDPALETFVRGLIVEEFDGAEPPPPILQGLGAYVRAIGHANCDPTHRETIGVDGMVRDVSRSVMAARYAWATGHADAARLLISGARSGLGLIAERYSPPGLMRDRFAVRRADLGLLAIEQQMDSGHGTVIARIDRWQSHTTRWSGMLKRDEGQSLSNPQRLLQSLGR